MSVDTRTIEKQEILVAGVIIDVPRDTVLPDEFKTMFHGETNVKRGKYTWWYPVKNTTYARLVNKLTLRYGIKVKYGIAGTMEV